CGMNSVSESLYMAAPMVLYPQTSEQKAVAGRASKKVLKKYLKASRPAAVFGRQLILLKTLAYRNSEKRKFG
ncbi:MAG: glucosyltransferase, partial [Eubacterium sp.]|nr:glucosyltransferase [Eubacterium sp.]